MELVLDEARRRLISSDERTLFPKRMLPDTNGMVFREYYSGKFSIALREKKQREETCGIYVKEEQRGV